MPNPINPQNFNRYAYGLNNPLKYIDPTGHEECFDAECKHRVNPITKELVGKNKEVVKSLTDGFEHVYRKPEPTSEDILNAFAFQATGAGADAAGIFESGLGAVAETALTLAGAFAGEGIGALPGFGEGVKLYNTSGLNLANDVFGVASFGGALASDAAIGNTYFAYNEKENAYALVMGTGSQFSFSTATMGLASPEAFIDLSIDTVSLLNDTLSTFQLGDRLTGGHVNDTLGLPATPADQLFTPKSISLPQSWNGFIEKNFNYRVTK